MMQSGERGFTDAMAQLCLAPTVEFGLVICCFTPVEGARAGDSIEVGVSVDELAPWPQAPPHWIHLSSDIRFERTNSQPSSKPGWLMHSRNVAGWGDAEPAVGWTSHLQAVLSEAIS